MDFIDNTLFHTFAFFTFDELLMDKRDSNGLLRTL